jgi:glyoxylase-like metal-dependent hydrolase (beta-lactamase superfamily II)
MKPKAVSRGVWRVGLMSVNVFLIEAGDDLVLIDAGLRNSPPRITEAIYSLDRLPQHVTAIVVTHAHRDHVGGLAEMVRRTGASVWMHPADAALVRDGVYGRPFAHGAGRVFDLLPGAKGKPIAVTHEVSDGEVLPFDGLRAVFTPGHSAGHLALLLPREGGVLFVGDAAANLRRPGLSFVNEDMGEVRTSVQKLASLEFETACFGHGRTIRHGAGDAFRELLARIEQAEAQDTTDQGA